MEASESVCGSVRFRIRLELARSSQYPNGSHQHGYVILASLNSDGHLDSAAVRHDKPFYVRRFWAGMDDRLGQLRHRAGGAGGAHWVIDYDTASETDDERTFQFDAHAFVIGEYVTIRHEQEPLTYRVVSVSRIPVIPNHD